MKSPLLVTFIRMKDNYIELMSHSPHVKAFFDSKTNTISYVVADSTTGECAIIDSVMDYEPSDASVSYESADAIISYVREKGHAVVWILETHVHADHLSAALYLKKKLGGKVAIGSHVADVQKICADVFKENSDFPCDGSQFDTLWEDGDTFAVGSIPARVMHVPGHTPSDIAYIIGDTVFVGDTFFMPDYGTARCDFPGGSAQEMFNSAQRLYALPDEMRMFLCHDYLPHGRSEYLWETTVGAQKKHNVHVKEGTTLASFVQMRCARDAELDMPRLIVPSIQVNIRAGDLPQDTKTGTISLKTSPNNAFSKRK